MRIAYDHQIFCSQSYGGISRYFVRLAEELAAGRHEVRIFAPLHQNRYARELPPGIVKGYGLPGYPPRSIPLFMPPNRILARSAIARWAPEIVHETYYSPQPSGPGGSATIVTVYDMIHERFRESFPKGDRTSATKRAAIARADHAICISQSTRRDLIELFEVPEEKVSYVHLGFERFPPADSLQSPRLSRGRPYLLFVGGRFGYKNFALFLRSVAASARLLRDFDVVAFGGGGLSSSHRTLIGELGFRDSQVRQIGGDDSVLGLCYREARAFVYPSLYEGFGLPPLEAMAQDCPVISSNTSSMPEVIGGAGEYFDPSDIGDMRRAIESVVYSDERVMELKALGRERLGHFSWQRCGNETLAIYERVVGNAATQPAPAHFGACP